MYNKFIKQEQKEIITNDNVTSINGSFNTPMMEIGNANLISPYINDTYETLPFIRFGNDNLYPQLVKQLSVQSPIHSGIIRLITTSIGSSGYEFENVKTMDDKIDIKRFEKKYKLSRLIKSITKDFYIHSRVCFIISVENGKRTFKKVCPTKVRNNKTKTIFTLSEDWSSGMGNLVLEEYKSQTKDGQYLYQYNLDDEDTYPLPLYNSALNWIYLDSEISFFQKQNIKQGVFPSLAVLNPSTFSTTKEVNDFRNTFNMNKGSKGVGNVFVFTANGKDLLPEIMQLQSNNNDKLFQETRKDINANICFAHSINPSLAGVATSGQLGNNQQIKDAFDIYKKVILNDLKCDIENILNDLLQIVNLKNTICINDFNLVELTETETATLNSDNVDEEEVIKLQESNDNLRGLSAQENMDIYRIIRDFKKGKLNRVLAKTRIMAYGIDNDTAEEILDSE